MDAGLSNCKRVKIVYFSGTGSTARVADCFEQSVRRRNMEVVKCELRVGESCSGEKEDLLFLVYAVHACNAPEPVYEWIKETPDVKGTRAVVISVSGGGEITPNTACRVGCIKRLQKKGYTVVYEKMLVMPSNWIVQTKDGLAIRLLEVLPARVERIVQDVIAGISHRTKPGMLDRFISWAGELEKIGARSFGRRIKAGGGCNGCGRCEKSCPRGNVVLEGHRPAFGGKCIMCLKCIYGCPKKALKPGFMKFIVVKEGYNLQEVEKRMKSVEPAPVENLAKGYLWKGVKEYLLEPDTPGKQENHPSWD